jgi:hypothetical protein
MIQFEDNQITALKKEQKGDRRKHLKLWDIYEIWPTPAPFVTFNLGMNTFSANQIPGFNAAGVFDFDSEPDPLNIKTQGITPSNRIIMTQHVDKLRAHYLTGIDVIEWLAPFVSDVWLLIKDMNYDFIDEFWIQNGKFGGKRWPGGKISIGDYIHLLSKAEYSRFQTQEFAAFRNFFEHLLGEGNVSKSPKLKALERGDFDD